MNDETLTTETQQNPQNLDEKQEGTQQEEVKKEAIEPEKPKEPEKKYTDEDVDRIIGEKFKKFKEEAEEAKKLAEMTAKEKIEYERDKLQKELDDLKKEKALNDMKGAARDILGEQGVQVGDNLLSMIVTDDAEATKESIADFVALFKEAVDKEVTERMRGTTPKRASGTNSLTKQEILDIKDPVERQRMIAKNLNLFT